MQLLKSIALFFFLLKVPSAKIFYQYMLKNNYIIHKTAMLIIKNIQ